MPSATAAPSVITAPPAVKDLQVKLFADGADKKTMLDLYANPHVQGFTTNPTLMRKAGITDYEAFAKDIVQAIPDRHISLEVFADELEEMERQARKIATFGPNVYAKIPVTNTKRVSTSAMARRLSLDGVKVNVTAILTPEQVVEVTSALSGGAPSCVSVFAGRIADTGADPLPLMTMAVELTKPNPGMEIIWASPREPFNVFQAHAIGCHIITATADILKKLSLTGKDLDAYSLETVQMFFQDATASGFQL
ncbi:MAG: transaldolase [Bryobacterales bacterium]|nr:transaldolase [Bryobacterales bacterium]